MLGKWFRCYQAWQGARIVSVSPPPKLDPHAMLGKWLRRYQAWQGTRTVSVSPPPKLDPNAPGVQRMIEIAKRYDLDLYDVLNPALHHYRFTLNDGSIVGPISIVEVLGIIDTLSAHGLYRRAIKKASMDASIAILPVKPAPPR